MQKTLETQNIAKTGGKNFRIVIVVLLSYRKKERYEQIMKHTIKKITVTLIVCLIISMQLVGIATGVTLAQAFSGGSTKSSTTTWVGGAFGYSWTSYNKNSWAKTTGYKGYHYVRATVGDPNNKPKADTGRVYKSSNNSATTSTVKYYEGDTGIATASAAAVASGQSANLARAYYGT